MSRQGSGFHGHRERREGHQKQYGIGSWYGTGDYYTGPGNSSDFASAPKRSRHNERYKDRFENTEEGSQYMQQDADYGLYTDFSSVSEKDSKVHFETDAGRSHVGGRRPGGDYHVPHRVPKNFWSSEGSSHSASHASGIPIRHHMTYSNDPGNAVRIDENYSWRSHSHLSRNIATDYRLKSGFNSDFDQYGTHEQRHMPSYRSEEARPAYNDRGRMFYGNRPSKMPIERDFHKPASTYNRQNRKYSDDDQNRNMAETNERSGNIREYHLQKKQSNFNISHPDVNLIEDKNLEFIPRPQREHDDRQFDVDGKNKFSYSGPRQTLLPPEDSDGYGKTRNIERKRSLEKTDALPYGSHLGSQQINPTVQQPYPMLERPHELRKEVLPHDRLAKAVYDNEISIEPKLERISPVPVVSEANNTLGSYKTLSGLQSVEELTAISSTIGTPAFSTINISSSVDMVQRSFGGQVLPFQLTTENIQTVKEQNVLNIDTPIDVNTQHLESEEELISKLDGMDKEIVECEEDIKNLDEMEHKLETELADLKHQMTEAENFKENNEEPIEEETIKDPKDKIINYFFEKFRPKNFDLISKIYKDNQVKAQISHAQLWSSNYGSEASSKPLYYQPSDLPFYFDNIRRHKRFRMKLIKFLQMKKIGQIKRDEALSQQYEKQKEAWLKKLDRIESNIKRKTKLAKVRAFYEREFPEIKRQREQQERMTRFGARTTWGPLARSEAEFEEIVDNLSEIEATEKQMHLLAVEPPKLTDKYERRIKYSNKNGLIRDVDAFERERKFKNIWCEEEKMIFKERFTQFPKDFEKIAEGLKRKTVSECVLYYYRNKKKENFKGTSKKPSKKTGRLQRQLVSTLTYAQPLPNIETLQQPQPIKTRQKEREREKAKEQEAQRDYGKDKEKPLRLEHDVHEKTEARPTRELRSNVEKSIDTSDASSSKEVAASRMVTPQIESQCKQSVDELIARYLAKKPLPAENVDPSRWSELEISKAIDGLKFHGRNWPAIAKMVSTKSEAQCKNFYFNYKRKFHLESILGISKHSTSLSQHGSIAGLEDDASGKRRRSKRNSQQDKDAAGSTTQVFEDTTQEKTVDVEEVQNDDSGLTEDGHSQSQSQMAEETLISNEENGGETYGSKTNGQERQEIVLSSTQRESFINEEDLTVAKDSLADEPKDVSKEIEQNPDWGADAGNTEEVIRLGKEEERRPNISQELLNTETSVEDVNIGKIVENPICEQPQRPDSLPVGISEMRIKEDVSSRPLPPPLTPVSLTRVSNQTLNPERASSPRSLLKGISLQGEIGAFKATLERTLEKDLNRKEGVAGFEIQQEKYFQESSQYHRHTAEVTLPKKIVDAKQPYLHEAKQRPEPFIPQSTLHPSLEQSAVIQAFAGWQPSLMPAQQHQMKHVQETTEIQKHYHHGISQTSTSREGVQVRPSSAPSQAGNQVNQTSPKGAAPSHLEARDSPHFPISRQGQFIFPAAASSPFSAVSCPSVQSMAQSRKDNNLNETVHSGMGDSREVPGRIPHQGVLYANPENPGDILVRPNEHFKNYRQRPMLNPAAERPFAGAYFESRYSLQAKGVRPRTYEELLERAASIPNLSMNRLLPPESPTGMQKALSVESLPHMHPEAREKAIFGVDSHKGMVYERHSFDAMGKKREGLEPRIAERRDFMKVVTPQRMTHPQHMGQVYGSTAKHLDSKDVPNAHPAIVSSSKPADHRILQYMPGSSSVPFARDFQPTLDHQLLRNIDGRQVNLERHHGTSPALPPYHHSHGMQGKGQKMSSSVAKDDNQRQHSVHQLKPNFPDDPRLASQASFLSSVSTSNIELQSRHDRYNSPDFQYGISTGVVQKVPPRMSITGSHQYLDTQNQRRSVERSPMDSYSDVSSLQRSGQLSINVKNFNTVDKIKSQSKNTRPSSVDSVIHKSFLTERQQQLSSSLGDLRNLTALHLSPTLPLSPSSASSKKTSFLFRPWEQEVKEGIAEGSRHKEEKPEISQQLKTAGLVSQQMTPLKLVTESKATRDDGMSDHDEADHDEALMSPTIPYTDPARETPVKDILSTEEDEKQVIAETTQRNGAGTIANVGLSDKTILCTGKAVDEVEGAGMDHLLKITTDTPVEQRPASPVDSEATLSADETEMELMSGNLRDFEEAEHWERKPIAEILSSGRELVPEQDSSFEKKKHTHEVPNERVVAERIANRPEAQQPTKEDRRQNIRIVNEFEEKSKTKLRKKSKSVGKGKKKSPKAIDEITVGTKELAKKADPLNFNPVAVIKSTIEKTSSIIASAMSPLTLSLPKISVSPKEEAADSVSIVPPIALSLPNIVVSERSDGSESILPEMVEKMVKDETKTVEMNAEISQELNDLASKREVVEVNDGRNEIDQVTFHESQTIADVEETSAAIDSIQNEGEESPSAEEDAAEPFLHLWPSADGYPCEGQTVSAAEEGDYQQGYDVEMRESRDFQSHISENEDKEMSSLDSDYINVPRLSDHAETSLDRGSEALDDELETRLAMVSNSNLEQVNLVSQDESAMFIPAFETVPISPPGSPVSSLGTQDAQGEMPPSDIPPSFAHSVLSLGIPVTSQSSPKAHIGAVAFPYSTLSFNIGSMPASRSGSLHGSRSSSACPSPNTLASIHNSPSASSTGLITRPDFSSESVHSVQHGDNLSNLTERLLNNDMVIPQDDQMTLTMDFQSGKPSEPSTLSTQNFTSTIEYEPLSDED